MDDEAEVSSELTKIAKLNGDFKRNYGALLGAILYLRSISAARRASHWGRSIVAFATVILTWMAKKYGWAWSPS
ncbi:hypothetical protein IVA80_10160 [Bradyrhizobium sp. 139]|uniref:hypothetical protein n=1 Tax=Bradyrhizobium sp. 139 TaxID=2782616 RepID=UPI001FFB226C|nr:hypothetical protein [Bradyrhizobium sp. 139]MCK1741223.1 hypothetical protein [Bradyrhizobium sp. 139]